MIIILKLMMLYCHHCHRYQYHQRGSWTYNKIFLEIINTIVVVIIVMTTLQILLQLRVVLIYMYTYRYMYYYTYVEYLQETTDELYTNTDTKIEDFYPTTVQALVILPMMMMMHDWYDDDNDGIYITMKPSPTSVIAKINQ